MLGFEFAITQDQSALDMFTDAIEPSDFNTASFDLKQKIKKQTLNSPWKKKCLFAESPEY